ncbi:MAG: hypothetical protein NT173_06420 [Opitutales bacterium]|nr:hypothetical protein [Opitutales bacterium]
MTLTAAAVFPFVAAHHPPTRMTSRERVLTTLACQQADRVPIDYFANEDIDRRLKAHFRLAPDDGEGLMQALQVDFRGVSAPYIGPKLHADIPERGVTVDNWGIHRLWIEHASGGYWDFCDFPLQEATEEQVAAWPLPSPDDFDYAAVRAQCQQYAGYAVFAGNAGLPDVINGNGMLRTMEQTLVDLLTDGPAAGSSSSTRSCAGRSRPRAAPSTLSGWARTWARRSARRSAPNCTAGSCGRCTSRSSTWRAPTACPP